MTFAAAFTLASLAMPVHAQDALQQIQLTEKQVQNYIAAQKDLAALSEKMGDKQPDAKAQADMEAAEREMVTFAMKAQYERDLSITGRGDAKHAFVPYGPLFSLKTTGKGEGIMS